jgi:anti-anti-sigma factor
MDLTLEGLESSPVLTAAESGIWRWDKAVDVRNAAQFHAEALASVTTGKKAILLDLSEAPHMDACGLQIVVALAVQALTVGRLFEIVKASSAIQRDLQLSGLSYLMRQDED